MKEIIEYLKARYLNEKAQGMVEYALMVAFIVGVAVVVFGFGSGTGEGATKDGSFVAAVKGGFEKVSTAIGKVNIPN